MRFISPHATIYDFKRVHDSLVKLGVDTTTLYETVGISLNSLRGRNEVTTNNYLTLLNTAAKSYSLPHIGIEMALDRVIEDIGTLGYLIQNASDFAHSLMLIEKYIGTLIPGCRANLISKGENHIWTYEIAGYPSSFARHDIELTLLQFIQLIQELLSEPTWRPEAVYFQYPAPTKIAALREHFGRNLQFDHWFNGVEFHGELCTLSISKADPRLLTILETHIDSQLADPQHSHNLMERIELEISALIGKAPLNADSIATRLGISRRTMTRHLAESGASFAEIRDNVIMRLAKEILITSTVNILEVAQQLGYSETSAFTRAFKKAMGVTPLKYRKLNQQRHGAYEQ